MRTIRDAGSAPAFRTRGGGDGQCLDDPESGPRASRHASPCGDLAEEILRLKQEPGKDILVHGGAEFVQALSKLGLIDEYRVIVHPMALGNGSPLFGGPVDLTLVDSKPFATGAVALVYEAGRA